MSVLNPPSSASYNPQLPILYNLDSLESSSTILYLRSHRQEAVPFLKKALETRNEAALDRLIESRLIPSKDLEELSSTFDWFADYYVSTLNKAADEKNEALFKSLSDMKRPLGQLLLEHSKLLSKASISQLLQLRKISAELREDILRDPFLEPTFIKLLEEAVFDSTFDKAIGGRKSIFKQSVVFSFFENSPLLQKLIHKGLEEKNVPLLKQLIQKELLPLKPLMSALGQESKLHDSFLEAFKTECRQRTPNGGFILFVIDAGLKFESSDIYPLAQSGNCALLRKIADRGQDISDAIFRLIKENSSIFNLFDRTNERGLDPNLKNQEGHTLLIEAVIQDKHSIVQNLLRFGANPLILDRQGRSVFDLSKGKSLQTRKALYRSPDFNGSLIIGSGSSWNNREVAEEEALRAFLDRHAQSKPSAHFYALFIKVENFSLALLKPRDPYPDLECSYQGVCIRHPENRIYCWAPSKLYGIPEAFLPNPGSMNTLGFVIKSFAQGDDEQNRVVINKDRYACIKLESEYKTKNPDIEQGFKYSYRGVCTHGHGKNPEALLAAFRQHREGIRLNWITTPDLSESQEELAALESQMNDMFEQQQRHADQLAELQEKVSSYIEQTGSIIEARYSVASSSEKASEEINLVEKAYNFDLKERLKNAHLYTFNEKKLLDWQVGIHRQIQVLQDLEKRLLAENSMNVAAFEEERKRVDSHLRGIRDMIVNRSVTSSEVPTLKVYMSSPLVEDIFRSDQSAINVMKETICRFIGMFLHKIPPSINQSLSQVFLGEFRLEIINQLHQEAQFIVGLTPLGEVQDPALSVKMQKLAIALALLQDTSAILEQIPPVPLTSDPLYFDHQDRVLEDTMRKHLESYASARRILDTFWSQVCHHPEVLKNHIDKMLELFMKRILLMDEEIRDVASNSHYYPIMEPRSPRRMLDEQLFLLTSSLLVLSSNQEQQGQAPWLQHMIEYLQLRLISSFHGVDKKKYKLEGLFLSSLLEVIPQIKDIVSAAWESNKSDGSPFTALNKLLEDYHPPKREILEGKLTEAFKKLSMQEPSLQLDPEVLTLVTKVREIRSEINTHKPVDQNDLGTLAKEEREHLERALKVFNCLGFGVTSSDVTMEWEIINHESFSSSDIGKLKEALVERLKGDIRSKVEALIQKTKGNLENSSIDKVKAFQRECAALNRNIHEYLSAKSLLSPLKLAQFKINALEILGNIRGLSKGNLEKSINKLSIVHDSLQGENVTGIELLLEVQNLSEQLSAFFKGKKGKKVADQYQGLPATLLAITIPHLEAALPEILRDLSTSLQRMQEGIYSMYFKKLEKMEAQLRLGLRKQTYYTTDQTNVSYCLWDGKPFDALPYHTDNEVHLPLGQKPHNYYELMTPSTYPSDEKIPEQENLYVTSTRDMGPQAKRRKLLKK